MAIVFAAVIAGAIAGFLGSWLVFYLMGYDHQGFGGGAGNEFGNGPVMLFCFAPLVGVLSGVLTAVVIAARSK